MKTQPSVTPTRYFALLTTGRLVKIDGATSLREASDLGPDNTLFLFSEDEVLSVVGNRGSVRDRGDTAAASRRGGAHQISVDEHEQARMRAVLRRHAATMSNCVH